MLFAVRNRLKTVLVFFAFSMPAFGAVTTIGNVDPTPDEEGGVLSGTLSVGLGGSGPNVGVTAIGSMRITSGSELVVGDGVVGNRRGANGTVEVSGAGTRWLSEDDFAVGNAGYGELNINGQGWVGNSDDFLVGAEATGRGWVRMFDPFSVMNIGDTLTVGGGGVGNLLVDNRARIISDDGVVGFSSGSLGQVEIGGQSSWLTRSGLVVGDSGNGRLDVHSGGLLDNASVILSDEASGRGIGSVSGIGSLWLSRDDFTVGDNNSAELLVEIGGTVQAIDDLNVRSRGIVRLLDGNLIADSISNAGVISGSGRISGALNITETGSMQSNLGGPLVVDSAVTNSGQIDVIDGHVQFQRQVTNEASGTIAGHDGILRFRGGLVNNGKLGFSSGATDVFGFVASTDSGSIHIGGEGTTTFYGDVTNAGTLRVEPRSNAVFLKSLSTTTQTQLVGVAADTGGSGEPEIATKLSVTGSLQVDGILSIVPSADLDFVTEPSERGSEVSINLANASQLTGQFSQVRYNDSLLSPMFPLDDRSFRSHDSLADETGIFRTLLYSDATLDIVNYWALEGDTDGDQDVDFGDFLIVSGNFGTPGTWTDGDFDGDGTVAFGDFLVLSTNFGADGLAAQSVPEPDVRMLLIMGFATLFSLCRDRKSLASSSVISPVVSLK